ncbi:hypothetical protein D3C71_1704280 [compost metagenome]
MHHAMVLAHAVQLAAIRLDLFKLIGHGVIAIGAPPHQQAFMLAGQGHLGLVVRPAPPRHDRVPRHALHPAWRGREAQVQVTGPRREFAQRAHRHGVAHAAPSCHVTWQTRTGMPCATQYCNQRIWLSCSLSPGPLTSMSS